MALLQSLRTMASHASLILIVFLRTFLLIIVMPALLSGCLAWLEPDIYDVSITTSVPHEKAERIRTAVQESLELKTRTLLNGGAPSCRYYEGVPVESAAARGTITVSIWTCIRSEDTTVPMLEFSVSGKARNLPEVKQEVDRLASRIEQVLRAESGTTVTREAGWFATP